MTDNKGGAGIFPRKGRLAKGLSKMPGGLITQNFCNSVTEPKTANKAQKRTFSGYKPLQIFVTGYSHFCNRIFGYRIFVTEAEGLQFRKETL